MQAESGNSAFLQDGQTLLQLGQRKAVFGFPGIAHNSISDGEMPAGIIPEADGFRNSAVFCQQVNIRNIVIKDHANDDGTILPKDDDKPGVNWVDVNSPDNLGAGFNTRGEMQFWWADAGWSQIGDPQFSYSNGVYTIIANSATVSEWQAQNSIHDVALPQTTKTMSFLAEAQPFQNDSNSERKPERGASIQGNSSRNITFLPSG